MCELCEICVLPRMLQLYLFRCFNCKSIINILLMRFSFMYDSIFRELTLSLKMGKTA